MVHMHHIIPVTKRHRVNLLGGSILKDTQKKMFYMPPVFKLQVTLLFGFVILIYYIRRNSILYNRSRNIYTSNTRIQVTLPFGNLILTFYSRLNCSNRKSYNYRSESMGH